jgi:hypothetical protein
MLSVAQIALGIVSSVLLLRHLPLIIRLGALLLLALVMVFLWVCFWPVLGPVCWIRRSNRWRRREHSSDVASLRWVNHGDASQTVASSAAQESWISRRDF